MYCGHSYILNTTSSSYTTTTSKKLYNIHNKTTIIIYRNYSEKKIDKLLILKIKNYCKKKKIKFYLSNNIKLAISLGLDGAYIPSFNNSYQHLSYKFKTNFDLIGSAHNFKEVTLKVKQGCSFILLSKLLDLFLIEFFLCIHSHTRPFLRLISYFTMLN